MELLRFESLAEVYVDERPSALVRAGRSAEM